MNQPTTNFVDWLVAELADKGLKRAFGVPGGGSSLDLLAALKAADIDPVITAREDAAVIMAGITGVLDQAPGLAFTTKGPGLSNAANGLASAALDRLPALLLSEAFDDQELSYLSHQVFQQSEFVAPLLTAGQGLELSATQEVVGKWLNAPRNRPAVMFPSAEEFQRTAVDVAEPSIEQISGKLDRSGAPDLLSQAKRPVVIVGLEAANAATAPVLRNFTSILSAPVLCTYMAKGTIADTDPNYGGIFTGGAIEQATVNQADLIILVGLDPVELIRKPWPYQAPVLDLCERIFEPHYVAPVIRLVAPLSSTLADLAAEISPSQWCDQEIAALRTGFFAGMSKGDNTELSSANVIKVIRDSFTDPVLPRLSIDAGAHMFSASAFWPAFEPRDVLISNGLASMGFALPAGIAAALQAPERGAGAITGDGGLLMCLGELKTAAETNANLTVVVFNDGCLSLIDIKRQERQFPDLGLSWKPPDFAAIAQGFGFQSWHVENASDLHSSLAAAARGKGPRLIDVNVDASGYPEQLRALRG